MTIHDKTTSPVGGAVNRRSFLQRGATLTGLAGGLAATLPLARSAHAAGDDLLRVGLVGCGGRGTGAATQALKADKNVKLFAMADAFDDKIKSSLAAISKEEGLGGKIDVPPERQFSGFSGYAQLLKSGVDVVILATPPGFRPLHLEAAVEAGKHIFAEKPVAVDAPGVRRVLEACRKAKDKNLSVVSGLCLRYSRSYREMMPRLHEGQVGDLLTLYANDYRGSIWIRPRKPDWTDMHYQMRNWYYFTWLSGDFNVEQHVHNLDICAWILGDRYPDRCIGQGGRQVRGGAETGHIYDHFSVTYEYESGERIISNTRQIPHCFGDISVHVQGSKGRAIVSERKNGMTILGPKPWTWQGSEDDFYQYEHDALFAAIRSGKPVNDGQYMCKSTLLAIMGRISAYTGQQITWKQALESQEDLTPPKYEWGELAVAPVPMPGVTSFK